MRPVLSASLAVALAGTAACKIDLDEAPPPDLCNVGSAAVCLAAEGHSDFQWLQDNMFSTNCSGKDCHGAPENGVKPQGKLVLAEGFAYKTLLGKEPTDPGPAPLVQSELTKRHKLVQPGEPNASYLYFMLHAITADMGSPRFENPPSDVGFMPQSNTTLCCQKLDAVRRWIEAGALP